MKAEKASPSLVAEMRGIPFCSRTSYLALVRFPF